MYSYRNKEIWNEIKPLQNNGLVQHGTPMISLWYPEKKKRFCIGGRGLLNNNEQSRKRVRSSWNQLLNLWIALFLNYEQRYFYKTSLWTWESKWLITACFSSYCCLSSFSRSVLLCRCLVKLCSCGRSWVGETQTLSASPHGSSLPSLTSVSEVNSLSDSSTPEPSIL